MTWYMSDEDYECSTVKVLWGSSFGTVAVYLASPVFISVWGWKSLFVFCALLGILGAAVSYIGITAFERRFGKLSAKSIKNGKEQNDADAANKSAGSFSSFFAVLCAIFAAIVFQGSLLDVRRRVYARNKSAVCMLCSRKIQVFRKHLVCFGCA